MTAGRPWPRLPAHGEVNALTRALQALRAAAVPVVDLTESNPTRAGLPYPDDLLEPLAAPRGLVYRPDPLGLLEARQAVADDCGRRGVSVDPAHVVLSASTSEAYTWLFKLLCAPGDAVLVPQPSYPLFTHLTALESVRAVPYELTYHGRWEIDFDSLAAAPPGTRAVLLVSPNNPTGSFVSDGERAALERLCAARGWALIVDEVFADYPLDAVAPVTDLAARAEVLTFSLGGASKSIGLPQIKLGWMVVGGPPPARAAALDGLELIADTFLSVGTPVQLAAPELLRRGAVVRGAIQQRIRHNLVAAREITYGFPACDVLPVGGGWTAAIRVPAVLGEERLVLELLERERILVHPGYFFDFAHEAFMVVSLLPPPPVFADALQRTLRVAAG